MPIKYHDVLDTVFLEAKGLEKINSFFSIQKCLKSRFSRVDNFKSHISHGSLLWVIRWTQIPTFLVHGVLVAGFATRVPFIPSRAWNQVMIPVIEKWCKVTWPETYIRLLVWSYMFSWSTRMDTLMAMPCLSFSVMSHELEFEMLQSRLMRLMFDM